MKVMKISFVLLSILFLFGCTQNDLKTSDFKTEYQAVLIQNGMGYFGKIEKLGTNYIEMTDVYYVHNQQNPETKEVQSMLIKRGKEWHGPDRMFINKAQVVMIEPVNPDSKVAKSMKEIKAKAADENKK